MVSRYLAEIKEHIQRPPAHTHAQLRIRPGVTAACRELGKVEGVAVK